MTLLPGGYVGPYEILASIGAGGMGEVFRARDTRLGRDVAIKVLLHGMAEDAERLRRFEQEARALAALSHPNVLVVHDVGTHDGAPYLVMELLLGQTLRQRLAGGPLPPSKALELGLLVAQGLAAAHVKGIIHRDLKPANVFLTSDGGLKILDFGLAKQCVTTFQEVATEALTEGMPSRIGVVLGTVGYMSPEQVRGEPADARSDVFALGVLIYEMLSGRSAFSGQTPADTLSAILSGDPPDLEAMARRTSAGVLVLLKRCIEKRREARFSSAHDVALALQALASPSSVASGPQVPVEKSIVVLPFENLSPDPDNAYFADGLTEELIADLSKVKALRVISRTSAMHFKGTTKQLPGIAQELKVRYVLEGSVRRAGNSLRITAQLIDAATDTHLWAEKYSGTFDDTFEMQEKVSRSIVASLEIHLSPEEDRRIAARPLPNSLAYDSYLRANQEINLWDAEALKRAERHLESARAIVGEHPLLLAAVSMMRFQSVNLGLAQDEALDEARQVAERALALDPTLAQAHAARGIVATLDGDNPTAIAHLRRARVEAPGDVATWMWLPYVYLMTGKTDPAGPLLNELLKKDPINPNARLSAALPPFFEGDFEASLPALREALRMASDWPMVRFWNALALAYALRRDAALEVLQAIPAEPEIEVWSRLGHLLRFALRGDAVGFDRLLTNEALISLRRDGQNCYHVAAFNAELGRVEEAFDWLERAVDRTFVPVALFLADPFLAPLRADPRFEGTLARASRVQAAVPDEP
jgi:eukaryotic-like serine/threonine-protein kinase